MYKATGLLTACIATCLIAGLALAQTEEDR